MPEKPDISLLIAELLSKHDEVVVSGIGTFFTKKDSDEFDIDSINLPSRALSFKDTFQSNDGRLANALCETYNLEKEQADQAIASFSKGIQRDLLLSKDCDLPGLGVLNFKQPDQIELGISYLDLDDSFFGLSKLNYKPIVREKSILKEDLSVKKISPITIEVFEEKEDKSESWSFKNVLLHKVSYLIIFLLSFGWFVLANQGQDTTKKQQDFKPVPTRINVAPEKAAPMEQKRETQITQSETLEENKAPDTGAFEHIMLYAFSNPSYIEKAKDRIQALGYEPIVTQMDLLQTIHIKVNYQSQDDFQKKFEEIKLKITHRAYIITE